MPNTLRFYDRFALRIAQAAEKGEDVFSWSIKKLDEEYVDEANWGTERLYATGFVLTFQHTAESINEKITNTGNSGARYVFDPSVKRYRDLNTGQFVSQKDLPYPPNSGFKYFKTDVLRPGTQIDRFETSS